MQHGFLLTYRFAGTALARKNAMLTAKMLPMQLRR
jgi:hypothetical protein